MPRSTFHVDWLRSKGYESFEFVFNRSPMDYAVWRKMLVAPDQLRQRMVHALAQIFVVSVEGVAGDFSSFAVGHFLDQLDTHAFGNYRQLLEAVTLAPAMGRYLSLLGSRRADAAGRHPDENYAREVMQLFSIGLTMLNVDGSVQLENGAPKPSYAQNDIAGLARALTGWDYAATYSETVATRQITPMNNVASRHETGVKSFLGVTIAANVSGTDSLRVALDALAGHPNVGPFIGAQLIQRMVTSNPSAAYVARVASVFNNNGAGVRGDLHATLRAVLMDVEARDATAIRSSTTHGKLREPVLRFTQWARACNIGSASDGWRLPSLGDPASRLGQSPMHSPSVFNFYRPGYVPPNTPLAAQKLVAPEFQITTETSVAGYLNFMQSVIANTTGLLGSDVRGDYAAWLPLADNPAALVAECNLVFAANRMSSTTVATVVDAVNSMATGSDTNRLRRVQAALLITMASPEFLVQQ